MPSIRDELAADLAKAIGIYGETFEWNGLTLPCVTREEPSGSDLADAGGFIDGIKLWIVAAKSVFPGGIFPEDGDLVNDGAGQIKKIKGVKDSTAPQIVLWIGGVDDMEG